MQNILRDVARAVQLVRDAVQLRGEASRRASKHEHAALQSGAESLHQRALCRATLAPCPQLAWLERYPPLADLPRLSAELLGSGSLRKRPAGPMSSTWPVKTTTA
jgi:hypothetical protein